MARPLVFSAILNWNNFIDADEALETLVAQTYHPHRVAVVDNGSTDDSLARLKEKWSGRVEFIATGENLGVAEGYSVILRAGIERGADFLMTFNNDITADPALVESLVEAMEAHPNAAAAVPVILYYDRPDVIWFAGATLNPWLGLTKLRHQGESFSVASNIPPVAESDWIVTCSTIYRREAIARVGLMDDRLFFGHDDVDWSLRARARGLSCLVVGRPLVRHKVGLSGGKRGATVITRTSAYTQAYGGVLIGVKHFKGVRRLTFMAGLLLIRAPYSIWDALLDRRANAILPFLRGLFDGLRRFAFSRG